MAEAQNRATEKARFSAGRRFHVIRQAFLFGCVGALNTGIDFFSFLLLTQVFSVYYGIAQVISYSAGMLNSYICNSKFTFSASKRSKMRLIKFILLNLVILVITLIAMHQFLFLPLIVDKLISTIIGLAFNFLFSKFWVFKN